MGRLLAVFAHPDDETFMCAGTLAKYASAGHQVTLVCATLGEMGRRMGIPAITTRESLGNLRQLELMAACEALGIDDLRLLGMRDKTLEIYPRKRLAERVLAEIERVEPDAIITFHEELGGHPDHCTIGGATTDAFMAYIDKQGHHKLGFTTSLYFVAWKAMFERANEDPLSEQRYIAINVLPYAQAKLAAFRAHRTQSQLHQWLWKTDRQAIANLEQVEYFIAHDPTQTVEDELLL